MLRIENIEKSFSNGDEVVQALAGVSLEVKQNEFVAVMGSSGSGKSTLMNIIGCLDSPSTGKYLLDNAAEYPIKSFYFNSCSFGFVIFDF